MKAIFQKKKGFIIINKNILRFVLLLYLALPVFAQASILGQASDFNVFVFNDFNLTCSDSQGSVAVGGNATLQNFAVGSSRGVKGQLVGGGNLDATSGSVGNGNGTIYGGGTVNLTTVSPNSISAVPPGNVVDFSAAETCLQNASTAWSGLAAI